jgi:hypothetical protein
MTILRVKEIKSRFKKNRINGNSNSSEFLDHIGSVLWRHCRACWDRPRSIFGKETFQKHTFFSTLGVNQTRRGMAGNNRDSNRSWRCWLDCQRRMASKANGN